MYKVNKEGKKCKAAEKMIKTYGWESFLKIQLYSDLACE